MRNTPTRYIPAPELIRLPNGGIGFRRVGGFPESSRQPSSWPLAITTARERTIAPPDAGMAWRRIAWCLLVAAALVVAAGLLAW